MRFALVLVAAIATAGAQQTAPAREPASKAAAILTWSPAKREQYIAALDSFFLTRTVKAGRRVHALDRGRPLAAFAPGGPRARYFDPSLPNSGCAASWCCRTAGFVSSGTRLRMVERRAGTRSRLRSRSRRRSSVPQ